MGGSILFTQSGTFKPSAYGLTAGKRINYIIIGGGGAGVNGEIDSYYSPRIYDTGGSAGGASSIGSYVTVNGGKARTDSMYYVYHSRSASTASVLPDFDVIGGNGEAGWIPGVKFTGYCGANALYVIEIDDGTIGDHKASPDFIMLADYGDQYTNVGMAMIPVDKGTFINSSHIKKSGTSRTYNYNDGAGYGAGGGGGKVITGNWASKGVGAFMGGYAGTYDEGSFELDSTADISITIGEGGTPHTSWSSYTTSMETYTVTINNAQKGSPGACMLWWD